MEAWHREAAGLGVAHMPSANGVCRFVAVEYSKSFHKRGDLVVAVIVRLCDYTRSEEARRLAATYYSFDIHAEWAFVLTSRPVLTLGMEADAAVLHQLLTCSGRWRGKYVQHGALPH